MKATTGAGKGPLPREGQYSRKTQENFSKGYDRAFGEECSICKGKGYHWDKDGFGKMVKTTCIMCKGTGKVKK